MKRLSTLLVLSLLVIFTACKTDNENLVTPDKDPDAETDDTKVTVELLMPKGTTTESAMANINQDQISEIKARVMFTKEDDDANMDRLYIFKSTNGGQDEQFIPEELKTMEGKVSKQAKKDGAVDLDGDFRSMFDFTFTILSEGAAFEKDSQVKYTFIATKGKINLRKPEKATVIKSGTITINYGTPPDEDKSLKTYTQTLKAPLADGTSETFMSVYDGEIYKLSDAAEVADLWDIGYYYGNTNKATLASPNAYGIWSVVFKDLDIDQSTTNATVFDTATAADWDAAKTSDDLTFDKPTNGQMKNLSVGDYLKFQDVYGNKGLIKVNTITGTTGTNGAINIDIKVAPAKVTLE